MKSPLPRTLSAVPRLPHVQFEIVKAIQVLLDQHVQPLPPAEKAVVSALDEEVGRELREACRQWLLARSRLHAAGLKATKAAVDDPIHPGWPARTPDSKGGQFRPKDGETVVAANTPGLGHNQGPPLEEPPKIPPKPPATPQVLNNFIKAAASWLAAAGKNAAAGYLRILQQVYWVTMLALPYIRAYLSPPKTLNELQQDALNPQVGYNIHHVVEQTPARNDGYPEDMINGPDNLVRIPTLKHWQINGWYGERNEKYDNLSPREYLRGKSWEERMRVGKEALILFKVLKP
jgi:hypothetical protein